MSSFTSPPPTLRPWRLRIPAGLKPRRGTLDFSFPSSIIFQPILSSLRRPGQRPLGGECAQRCSDIKVTGGDLPCGASVILTVTQFTGSQTTRDPCGSLLRFLPPKACPQQKRLAKDSLRYKSPALSCAVYFIAQPASLTSNGDLSIRHSALFLSASLPALCHLSFDSLSPDTFHPCICSDISLSRLFSYFTPHRPTAPSTAHTCSALLTPALCH